MSRLPSIDVLGGPLSGCSSSPKTGYFRDGLCDTGPDVVSIGDLKAHALE